LGSGQRSGWVLKPCHFFVTTIQAFNLSSQGIRFSAQKIPDVSVKG
jgi:hypothetical protein